MKSNRVFIPLLAATIGLSGGGFISAAHAQNAPAPQSATEPVSQHIIRLQNVPPSLLAWWIDPAHNAEPTQLTGSAFLIPKTAPDNKLQGEAKAEKGAFSLPTGIARIVAIEPQKTLLVLGTEAGYEELKKIVALLDKPLRQVEVEAQFTQIEPSRMNALGIKFDDAKPEQANIGFLVRGNFQPAIPALIEAGQIKIITAPRVLANNNMTATMGISPSRPAVLGFKDETGKFQELFDSAPQTQNPHLRLGTTFQFVVTPKINNDDTITLAMAPKRVLQLKNEAENQTFDLKNLGGLEIIANVRDGDTIAVRGLDASFFADLGIKKNTSNSEIVMFVTPRIMRRFGDAEVQPVALTR